MAQQRTRPAESETRRIVDRELLQLGWNTSEQSSANDVTTERAKTPQQQQALAGKRPDYVLYEPGTDRPIAVIEAKRPGNTLTEAIRDATEKYAEPLKVDIVFATDGTLCQTFDRRQGGPLLLDGEPITNLLTAKLLVRFAKEGPRLVTPTKRQQTKIELISIFSQANALLRKEGLRQGVERFSEFSNFLFLKLISEIEAQREKNGETRQLESRYCWEAFSSKPAEEMLDYINDTVLPRLVNSYNHSGEVFQPQLQIADPSNLKAIVARLSKLSLLDAESDVKGDAFEYFLKHSVTVGNDLGEYFTPRHIVKLIVELVDPRFGETVYDPCCGTGGFLIAAFRHIEHRVSSTQSNRHVLENETIYGRELTGTARIAKMNMILAGDGHTNIFQQDCLKEPVREEHGVILTNFPFSQQSRYGDLYGLDTEDANPIFLKHVIDACKEGGRIGVVVPEGLLFGETQQYVNVRRFLVENCSLQAVIALHEFVFRPYTGQPTAILILTKGQPSANVWFYDVSEDGFEKTGSKTGRPPSSSGENHLNELRSVWSKKPQTARSYSVSIDNIRENLYKLSYSAYLAGDEPANWVPLGGENGLCEIRLGATPQKPYRGTGSNLWVKIADMKTRYVTQTTEKISDLGIATSSVKLLPKGTVMVSFKLTIGKVAIAGTDLYTNEAIAGLIPRGDYVLPEYLYHLIPSLNLRSYMQPAAKGKTLNKKILSGIRIPVPSLAEQQSFVDKMNQKEAEALKLREQANDLDRDSHDAAQAFLAKH